MIAVRRTRTPALTFTSALVLITGFLAVAQSPWWWPAVLACAGLVVLVGGSPARLQRRVELLHGSR